MRLSLILFVATLVSTSHAEVGVGNPIRMLRRPASRSGVRSDSSKINCQSFRVGVEANNLRDWDTIPSYCKSYIKTYLEKKQYGLDVEAMVGAALDFADSFDKHPNDAWVFDVEETLITNLKYLASSEVQYGTKPINTTSYYEWLTKNSSGVAQESIQELYYTLLEKEYDIFVLSGAQESLRDDLITALENVGYIGIGWANTFILKGEGDNGKSVAEFKSEKRRELVKQGYRIVGNVGDQWSDLSGEDAGIRTFKVPNPVYYIP